MSYLPQAFGAHTATGTDMLVRIGMALLVALVGWGFIRLSDRWSER
jgi:hypothetical protein